MKKIILLASVLGLFVCSQALANEGDGDAVCAVTIKYSGAMVSAKASAECPKKAYEAAVKDACGILIPHKPSKILVLDTWQQTLRDMPGAYMPAKLPLIQKCVNEAIIQDSGCNMLGVQFKCDESDRCNEC
ncbi:MAG: hypothetical protein FWC40_00630 [Proteobacteria bacterium]|nr:hypothetical protein [Pseudomonadota bacterium]